ncbi:hypothetical protein JCM10213_009323 [Rhodosporidiobolus nylandii]
MLRAPSFRTTRLSYRALEPSDADFIKQMYSDPQTELSGLGGPTVPWSTNTAEETVAVVGKSRLAVIICMSVGGVEQKETPVGWMRLSDAPAYSPHRCASFGIFFVAEHCVLLLFLTSFPAQLTLEAAQGKGYGSEALQWLLETAFLRFGYHRVECGAFAWNAGAIKLYKKLGFVEEGRKRERLFQEGTWQDEVLLY